MNTFLPWSQGRLIAVDHGTRRVKLLLAAAHGAGVRVLDQKIVDLQEEGLLTPEEIHRHLAELIQAWGDWPLALTLPAPLTFSQVLDLPAAGEADLPKIIAEQTDRLRGVSPSPLVYEAVPLEPHGAYQRPYYITLAREDDVNQHLHRVTDTVNEVRDVSPVAGALVAAYGAVNPVGQNCILVDIGDTITVVAVVRRQRPVFASSFGSGVAGWIQEAARAAKCPSGEMETRLGVQDLFTGADALPALTAATEEWLTELRKLLDNWQRANPNEPAPAKMPILVSGGALQLRGLLEFLRTRAGFPLSNWPAPPHVRVNVAHIRFRGGLRHGGRRVSSPPQSAVLLAAAVARPPAPSAESRPVKPGLFDWPLRRGAVDRPRHLAQNHFVGGKAPTGAGSTGRAGAGGTIDHRRTGPGPGLGAILAAL